MANKNITKQNIENLHLNWKNPHQAKRREKSQKPNSQLRDVSTLKAKNEETEVNADLLHFMNNFRDGIKGISSSVQQFEKTMESLTQLYQTIDKLGGIKRLNQLLSSAKATQASTRTNTDNSNIFKHLQSFMGILEKVDFNQINQFLGSPMTQGIVNDEETH